MKEKNIRIPHLSELDERAYWYSVESQSGRQSQLSLLTRAMMLMKSAVLEALATNMMKTDFEVIHTCMAELQQPGEGTMEHN